MVNGGLTMEELNNNLIFFGFEGVVFSGVHSCVTMQITKKATPFMLIVHYVSHWTNLVV
jgi:hypothetical protein